MNFNKKLLYLSFCIIGCSTLSGCFNDAKNHSFATMISVSSDGRYVISAHHGKYLILWDVKNRTKKIVSTDVNIFSPYFIKKTNKFIWQDIKSNTVHVQDVTLKEIKKFNPGFSAYGQVMSPDLKHYYASDDKWNIYHITENQKIVMKPADSMPSYKSAGKLLNLTLVDNLLLSVGLGTGDSNFTLEDTIKYESKKIEEGERKYSMWGGVMLWDGINNKPLNRFTRTVYKTVGVLSPDGKFVLAADENISMRLWDSHTGNIVYSGDIPTDPDTKCYSDEKCKKELAEELRTKKVIPEDFEEHILASYGVTVGVKFIDEQGDYLRFYKAINYGVLYNVKSPEIIDYINLGKKPQPDTFSVFYSANIIDTAPKANILVMGQAAFPSLPADKANGIIVYKFDPKTKKLKRIWAPEGPPPYKE